MNDPHCNCQENAHSPAPDLCPRHDGPGVLVIIDDGLYRDEPHDPPLPFVVDGAA